MVLSRVPKPEDQQVIWDGFYYAGFHWTTPAMWVEDHFCAEIFKEEYPTMYNEVWCAAYVYQLAKQNHALPLNKTFEEAYACGSRHIRMKPFHRLVYEISIFISMRISGDLHPYTRLNASRHTQRDGWKKSDEYCELLVAYTFYKNSKGNK